MDENILNIENKIKEALSKGFTFVVFDGVKVVHLDKRDGILPVFEFVKTHVDDLSTVANFSYGDKIVGKAAAFLFVLLKPRFVYAKTLSENALTLLKNNNLEFSYGETTPFIKSRDGKDRCPFEKAVEGATSPIEALKRIEQTLLNLKILK